MHTVRLVLEIPYFPNVKWLYPQTSYTNHSNTMSPIHASHYVQSMCPIPRVVQLARSAPLPLHLLVLQAPAAGSAQKQCLKFAVTTEGERSPLFAEDTRVKVAKNPQTTTKTPPDFDSKRKEATFPFPQPQANSAAFLRVPAVTDAHSCAATVSRGGWKNETLPPSPFCPHPLDTWGLSPTHAPIFMLLPPGATC